MVLRTEDFSHPETQKKNFGPGDAFDFSPFKIAILCSRWYKSIGEALVEGAQNTLQGAGIPQKNLYKFWAAGSFELPLLAQQCAELSHIHGLIVLGCVVQGLTPHFHYISATVSTALMNISLQSKKPLGFGLLTVHTQSQALERSQGKNNKGKEAAHAVLDSLRTLSNLRDN
ncbi:MAG: 6,7-dimethyl-8-ribityllumazine synthase [Cytophagales bacterium]|nr:6,7-dimethyl-8-ribityllumazine synthase [Cytophagales bacterium]